MKTKLTFNQKIAYWASIFKFLMVGLDIEEKHIPDDFLPGSKTTDRDFRWAEFICHIVDLTAPYCCGWKPNLKFYEGSIGRARLEIVCKYITAHYPDHILLGDNKDGDIGNTNKQALTYYTKTLGMDAVTLNPLMGYDDSMEIFLSDANIAGFLLCLTSNKGRKDLLDRNILIKGWNPDKFTQRTYIEIAKYAKDDETWNKNKNLHLVVGATNDSHEIRAIREAAGEDAIFLMPGFGAQGGDLVSSIRAAINRKGEGFLAVVARHIIAPELNEGETFDNAVIRQSKYYNEAFASAASEA